MNTSMLNGHSVSVKAESYSLLRDAYQIIDGIPEENFDLRTWVSQRQSKSASCVTIACAGGWLSMHPHMVDLGLTLNGEGYPEFGGYAGCRALAGLFEISFEDSASIFGHRSFYRRFDPTQVNGVSDKSLWLYRVRKFLAEKDAECAK